MKPKITQRILSVILFAFALPLSATAQTIGERVPPWTEGTLDIHHINTGRGNAAFFIFPDGTTMLVDAGDLARSSPRVTSPRPDSSRGAGEWIARYIRHKLSPDAALDYAYLTHFHADHMGGLSPDAKASRSGAYKLTGITEVAEHIPLKKILDRGWPDYTFPQPLRDPLMDNYRAFLKWQTENNGMKVERFQPGRADQIVPIRDPKKYPFEARNIAANGEIWTGVGTTTRQQFPAFDKLPQRDQPTENMCSIVLRLSYGKFDYYTGGDIPGVAEDFAPAWHDIETPVAKAVGPVEACVLDHHGNRDSMNAFFLSALRPQVLIIPVWSADHPGHTVLARIYSTRIYADERDVFATNMLEANKIVIGPMINRIKSMQGHILLRVDRGGNTYKVIILDDSAETFKVKAVFGPYRSR
ncbi:MAG: hypothetical protein AB1631_13915 [Acidobacteriota bacterium]